MLAKAEWTLLRRRLRPRWAPVFVIGLPRSGTTLLYQVLARGLSLSYLCNLAAEFPHSPGIVTLLLSKLWRIEPPSSFTSRYGETRGGNGVNQGHGVWARWFGDVQGYVGAGIISNSAIRELRGTVSLIERAFDAPFLSKSLGHSVRMRALNEAFPNALFLQVSRDRLQTAQSILRGRKDFFGNENQWFSLRPRQYRRIVDHDVIDQICEQIYFAEENVVSDARAIGTDRVFQVRYEEFCKTPRQILTMFRKFYHSKTGLEVRVRHGIPDHFRASHRSKCDEQDRLALSKRIRELWADEVCVSDP